MYLPDIAGGYPLKKDGRCIAAAKDATVIFKNSY